MNHVLPPEYQTIFGQLHDRAPTVPYSEVAQMFQEEFSKSPHEVSHLLLNL